MSLVDKVDTNLAESYTLGVNQPLAHLAEQVVPDVHQTSSPQMQAYCYAAASNT